MPDYTINFLDNDKTVAYLMEDEKPVVAGAAAFVESLPFQNKTDQFFVVEMLKQREKAAQEVK